MVDLHARIMPMIPAEPELAATRFSMRGVAGCFGLQKDASGEARSVGLGKTVMKQVLLALNGKRVVLEEQENGYLCNEPFIDQINL